MTSLTNISEYHKCQIKNKQFVNYVNEIRQQMRNPYTNYGKLLKEGDASLIKGL